MRRESTKQFSVVSLFVGHIDIVPGQKVRATKIKAESADKRRGAVNQEQGSGVWETDY
jgi:hypothetical protein